MTITRTFTKTETLCAQCQHPQSWHRADDADQTPITDPARKFRCIGYDCEVGGKPQSPCGCEDFASAEHKT